MAGTERMVVLFSMFDGQRRLPGAVSTRAMDDLEKPTMTRRLRRSQLIGQATINLSLSAATPKS
jgi:hypothetical protein